MANAGDWAKIKKFLEPDEEILLKNEMLQSLNIEKDKFFSIIAHDLRGPLSSFVGASQLITEEIQNMSVDEIMELALSMKTSATNIYSLLEKVATECESMSAVEKLFEYIAGNKKLYSAAEFMPDEICSRITRSRLINSRIELLFNTRTK
ncbi:MAG: hypothetical protein HGA41_02860 [Syntrophaceae bacterium]|nr:hypothetical protein [Syntrophaceae bacterium]